MKARNRLTNQIVAIKCVNDNFESPYACRKLLREIKIMRKLSKIENNIFTPRLLDVIIPTEVPLEGDSTAESSLSGAHNPSIQFSKTHLFLVMEYVENDMKMLMNSVSLVELQEEHIITIMYNALCSLKFIHSCNIIHRDLKPANFLIDLKCGVKICDFGLARTMPKKEQFW